MISDQTTFTGIPRDRIMDFWSQAEPFLWRAVLLTDGDETMLNIRHDLLDGDRGLWAAFTDPSMQTMLMAVTTRLVTFGSGRVKCEICHLGGDDMKRWLGFLPKIEAYARDQGCHGMRIMGRKGWERVLPDYRQTMVVLERTF